MSHQYSITLSARPQLTVIAKRLQARGLLPLSSTESKLSAALANTPRERIERWGGDVEISVAAGDMLLTINATNYRNILDDVLDELRAQGISASVEEP